MPVSVQIQIVIFAVIAAVVLFQLYNVLGKKVGRQPEEDARAQPQVVTPAGAGSETTGPRPGALDAVTAAAIAGLKARDPGFDPVRFLEGARQAYETIVRAYAAGDRETLKPLLAARVMDSFEAGIAAREARGEVEEAEFVHSPRADLEEATAEDNRAVAKVRFLAELRNKVRRTAEPEAEPQVEERRVAEIWTFERQLGASDPNWVLAGTEAATA